MENIQNNVVNFLKQLKQTADLFGSVTSNMVSSDDMNGLSEFQLLYLETLLTSLESESFNENRVLLLQDNNTKYVCIKGLFPPRNFSEDPKQLLTVLMQLTRRSYNTMEPVFRESSGIIPICNMFTLMYSFMAVYTLHAGFVFKWNVSLDSIASYMNDTLSLPHVVYSCNLDLAKRVYLFYTKLHSRRELQSQGKEFVMAPTFQSLVAQKQWDTVILEIDLFLENSEDRYNFVLRFIETHKQFYKGALQEIQSGQKRTHWIWYMFPTPPFVQNGLEMGSFMNQKYALRDSPDALTGNRAALAYLLFPTTEEINLRAHLIQLTTAVLEQLERGTTPTVLLGAGDVHKLQSCMTLFRNVTKNNIDPVVYALCQKVLNILE